MSCGGDQTQKSKAEENRGEFTTAEKVLAGVGVVGVAALAYGISKFLFSGSGERRTMKAPGGASGLRIFRDDFENNPSAYFRDLHRK